MSSRNSQTWSNTEQTTAEKFIVPDKTKKERLLHALMFEAIALVICAPALAWIMDKPITTSASLTVMNASCAMIMNILFNTIFDRVEKKMGFDRTVLVRIIHASLFEISLLALIVPLGALLLNISLYASLAMNVGLIFFFLPYTYIYNLAYDKLRFKYYYKKSIIKAN